MDRYHRQTLLPQIGPAGQARLAAARVLLVGCGALGSVLADQLVRAGVGHLRIVDRDVVEWTNLQRQVLYDEADAREGTPKAVAAARRLAAVNSAVRVEAFVSDVNPENVEDLAGLGEEPDLERMVAARANHDSTTTCHPERSEGSLPAHVEEKVLRCAQDDRHSRACGGAGRGQPCDAPAEAGGRVDLILDGTDNVETRYLINDVSVKHRIPWVYGACVGTEGRVMAVRPGQTPCLRCLFPEPPGPGELPTCDTAGVLAPAAAVVASLQATAALRLLTDGVAFNALVSLDVWRGRFHSTPLDDARRHDCRTCGQRQFDFLENPNKGRSINLCGRNAIQIRPAARGATIDLHSLAGRLQPSGTVELTPHLLRFRTHEPADWQLTLFRDGRAMIQGTQDPERAKSLYARWIGS